MDRHLLSTPPNPQEAGAPAGTEPPVNPRRGRHRFHPPELTIREVGVVTGTPAYHPNCTDVLKQRLYFWWNCIKSGWYAGHPTLTSCSLWQLNVPLINKMVKHTNIKMNIGSTGKTIKRVFDDEKIENITIRDKF